jgi:hypothetical protein
MKKINKLLETYMDYDICGTISRSEYLQVMLDLLEFAIKQIEDEPERMDVHLNLLRLLSDSLTSELRNEF